MWIKKGLSAILDFVLPRRCLMCGDFTQSDGSNEYTFSALSKPSLCGACWHQIAFITKPYCLNCSAPLAFDGDACFSCVDKEFSFDTAHAVLIYNDTSKTMITRFKHAGQAGYVRLFAPWMRKVALDVLRDQYIGNRTMGANRWDGLVAVPLHPFRFFSRGFNQASLLAGHLKLTVSNEQIPLIKGALKRVRHTASQGHQSPEDRKKNIRHAIIANADMVNGKDLLLIDDVMTTGATLHECAAVLKKAGAKRVDVLVLARAVRGGRGA